MVAARHREQVRPAPLSTKQYTESEPTDAHSLSVSPSHRAAIWLLLAGLCALIIAGTVALTHGIPDRDSGEFLYVAQQILHGHVPYRDTWDHKPPAIFYIDALALLSGHGLHLLWVVEWL